MFNGLEPVEESSTPAGFAGLEPVETAPAKPLSLHDHLTTTKTAPGQSEDKYDPATEALPFAINTIKKAVMAIPGLPGNIVAAGRSFGMKPEAFDVAGPVGMGLRFLAEQQAKQPKEEAALLSGEYLAEKLLGADLKMKPANKTMELAGDVLGFVSSVPAGPIKALVKEGPAAAAKALAQLTGFGTAVTAAGEGGQLAFGEGPVGKVIGELMSLPLLAVGGRWASLATKEGRDFVTRLGADAKTDIGGIVKPFVERTVENRFAQGMKDYAPAEANILESEALRNKMGTQLTAGQATNAPGVVADELAVRRSSNAAVSAALQQDKRNADAVLAYIKPSGPAEGEKAVNDLVTAHNARLDVLRRDADLLREKAKNVVPLKVSEEVVPPAATLTAEQRGMNLTRQQVIEKEREDAISKRLYDAAGSEANKLGATFSQDAINLAARRLSSNAILAYDEKNLPTVVTRIRIASNPEGEVVAPSLLERGLNAGVAPAAENVVPRLTYEDISAMRTAVNQDISAEAISTNANKNQRIKALTEMKATIDGAIAESEYPSVAKLYQAATEYYRNTYSPKFNQGLNSKLMMRDSYGNPKVFSEKLLDQYTATETNANAFLKLFGKNPEAMATMEDHLLAKFGRPSNLGGVVKDGTIDLKAFDTFIKKHEAPLKILADGGIPSLGRFTALGAERRGLVDRNVEITEAAKRLAQQLSDRSAATLEFGKEVAARDLGKLLGTNNYQQIVTTAMKNPQSMERLTAALGESGSKSLASTVMRDLVEKLTYAPETGKIGLNNDLFNKWLQDNSKSAEVMFKAAYGPDGGGHLQRLKEASRMLAIMDRVPTPAMAASDTKIGRDPLQEKIGITMRSFFNMGRAILQKRASEPDAAVFFGGQAFSHIVTKEYNKLMQSVASDPESSKYLLQMLKSGAASPQTKETSLSAAKAMGSLFAKAGHYYLGGRYYFPALAKMAPMAIQNEAEAK